MPTPAKGPRMGGSPAHERLMLSNLATQLFQHGRITTTEAKAKRLRPYAEKLVTFGKRGDLHARRQVLKVIRDKSVVHELFAEIGPRYENRPGGYTRIVKLGPRKGDNAPMALIELVEALTVAQSAVGEAERARGTRTAPRKAPTPATRESAADLSSSSPTAAAVAAAPPSDSPVVTEGESGVDEAIGTDAAPTATAAGQTPARSASAPPAESPAPEAPPTEAPPTEAPQAESPAPEAPPTEAPPTEAPAPVAVAEVQDAVEELTEAQQEQARAEADLAAAKEQLAQAEAAAASDEDPSK